MVNKTKGFSFKNKKLITILIILLAIVIIASAIIIYLQKTNIIIGNVIEPLTLRTTTGGNTEYTLCPDGQEIREIDGKTYSYSCESTLFNNQCPAGSNIASDKYCSENNRICCKTRVSDGGTNPQNPCPQGCLECEADGTCVYADPNDCFPACPQGQVCNRIGRPTCSPRECNENSDCRRSSDGRQLVCDGGLCVYCKTDVDCRAGETCRQSDKRCVSPQPTPTNTQCSGSTIIGDITYTNLRCTTSSSCRTSSRFNEIKLDAFGVICEPTRFGRQRICCGKKPAEPTNPIPPPTEPNPTDTQCSGNIIENGITYSLSCSQTTRCTSGQKIDGRTGCGTV
ncbi:hypothetical protein HYW74_00335, partial [Candidatus Pacearchaeota archaeon]|nr:hypothetical protein [Candidatus Pacearchaeota archaeon]